ncbi:MAG: hypothetical protein J6Y54_03945 [Lentisphaeria bacterium]|nr:hypothetical protein [Lentisphaeria bacterium]
MIRIRAALLIRTTRIFPSGRSAGGLANDDSVDGGNGRPVVEEHGGGGFPPEPCGTGLYVPIRVHAVETPFDPLSMHEHNITRFHKKSKSRSMFFETVAGCIFPRPRYIMAF